MDRNLVKSWFVILMATVLLVTTTEAVRAAVNVAGNISGNTTWTAAEGPYLVVGDVQVNPGITLTIEAGTVVKFNGTLLYVSGTLNAQGTTGSPVYFTSYHDDSVGGDSNGNGGDTSPAPGNWVSILVHDGGSATLSHCTIRYAGAYMGGSAIWNGMGGIFKTGPGNLSVDHCTVTDTSTKGIWLSAATGTVAVTNSTISNNPVNGILLEGSSATITLSGNAIQNNTGSGIYVNNSSPTIAGNTISGNTAYGISVTGIAIPGSISNNTISGNTSGSIGIDANSSGVPVAENNTFSDGLSIIGGTVDRDITWGNNYTYVLKSDVAINTGRTVTVPAGRVVKFNGTYIYVSGTLNAQGTTGSPVYFTSYHDDSVGGDSNGNGGATTPAAGQWVSIAVNDGGSANLSNCFIRYAGAYMGGSAIWNGMGGIFKTGSGNLSVEHCTVTDTSTKGIWLSAATGTVAVTNSTISNNPVNGILLEGSSATITLSGNAIQNNTGSGIYVNNSSPTIAGNTISGNTAYGISVTGIAIPGSISNNTISGNTSGSIGIDANSSGVPVAADNSFTDGLKITGGTVDRDIAWNNNRTYAVMTDVAINPGKTLTIPAGQIVKFNGTYLYVSGTLNALGSSGSPVYFTSYHDDSVGGDTNGNGGTTSPAPGHWVSIAVNDGGSAHLSNCVIRYAGAYMGGSAVWSGMGGIYKAGPGNLSVDHCTIVDNGTKGLWISGATGAVSITDSVIQNNSVNGILLDGSSAAISLSGNTIRNNVGSGIAVNSSSPVISSSLVSGNSGYGISVNGSSAAPTIARNRITANPYGVFLSNSANPVIGGSTENGNDIYGNTGYGVYNDGSAVTVNARYNWWGSDTGPAHASNPGGTGNAVTDYVDFSNFAALSYQTFTLTVALSGTGEGTVSRVSRNGGGAGGGNGGWTVPIHLSEPVTLAAVPAPDARFAGWSGAGCGGAGDCSFVADGDATVTATFTAMPPVADFSGTPLTGYEPLIVSFSDASQFAPQTWLWSFGEGDGSALRNPVHDYVDAGVYTVSLTASNNNGTDSRSKTDYVTVTACPNGPASILPNYYATLQEAYTHSSNDSVIRARYKVLDGSLNLDQNRVVYLYGGYNCSHEAVVGRTTIKGALSVERGVLTVEGIALR